MYAHKHKNTPQFEMAVPQSASPVLMRIWGKQINDAIVLMRARTFIVDHHESAAARSCSWCMTHLYQVPKVIERCLGVPFHVRRRRVTHEPHQLSLFYLIFHKPFQRESTLVTLVRRATEHLPREVFGGSPTQTAFPNVFRKRYPRKHGSLEMYKTCNPYKHQILKLSFDAVLFLLPCVRCHRRRLQVALHLILSRTSLQCYPVQLSAGTFCIQLCFEWIAARLRSFPTTLPQTYLHAVLEAYTKLSI